MADMPVQLQWEGRFFEVGDARLFGRLAGNGSTPVLCLAGGPGLAFRGDEAEWLALTRAASVCLLDLRGTGFSDRLVALDRGSVEQDIADIDAVRRRLGWGAMVLCGQSYGAKLALRYALAHPDAVAGLVLCDYVPVRALAVAGDAVPDSLDRALAQREAVLLSRYPELRRPLGTVLADHPLAVRQAAFDTLARAARWRAFAGEFMALVDRRQAPAWERLRLDVAAIHPLAAQADFEVLIAHVANGLREPSDDEVDQLGRLALPTLVVAGLGGLAPGAEAVRGRLQAVWPQASLLLLEHSGRGVGPRDTARFARAVERFLRGPVGQAGRSGR
jgi:pimeloyl-ACP methyl ester carboxylesterase